MHLEATMPKLPQAMIAELTENHGLSTKDAGTLLALDDGDRLDYFYHVLAQLAETHSDPIDAVQSGRAVGNWYVISSQISLDQLTFVGS